MREITYLDMEKAISKPYITYKEVMILAMCGENRARELMKGIAIPTRSRPMLVSTDDVLRLLDLSASKIHQEAEAIRKSGITASTMF